MKTSLKTIELSDYIMIQCKNFFPDNTTFDKSVFCRVVKTGLDWADYCYSQINIPGFFDNEGTVFNHMHTDQYAMFLTKLANVAWFEYADSAIALHLMYLNKVLHGINCMYDNKMPDIYYFPHAALGATIGKASFGNYLVISQHVTIGAHHGVFPQIGSGVVLGPGSSIIGPCIIGDRVSISIATDIFKKDIPNDNIAFRDEEGKLIIRKRNRDFWAEHYFKWDI